MFFSDFGGLKIGTYYKNSFDLGNFHAAMNSKSSCVKDDQCNYASENIINKNLIQVPIKKEKNVQNHSGHIHLFITFLIYDTFLGNLKLYTHMPQNI